MNKLLSKLRRPATAHKGDFGRVFILAGSRGFTGAAHLAAMGALRAGAGLVTLGVPETIYPMVARREAEVMVRPFPSTKQGTLAYKGLKEIQKFIQTQDVLAIGPGLSQNPETQKLICTLLKKINVPVVIDADGLNALKGHTEILNAVAGKAVLTPHPGEFARLFPLSSPNVFIGDPFWKQWIPAFAGMTEKRKATLLNNDSVFRKKVTQTIVNKFKVVLLLKGHHTVVAAPGEKTYINQTGNPGMAKGGTGDVLTGIIASFAAQMLRHCEPRRGEAISEIASPACRTGRSACGLLAMTTLFEAACLGVYLHGLTADLAVKKTGQISLIASDLLEYLPSTIKKAVGFKR